jgi:hypothetical protein
MPPPLSTAALHDVACPCSKMNLRQAGACRLANSHGSTLPAMMQTKPRDRFPLGRWSTQSTADPGSRIGAATGGSDLCWRPSGSESSQGSHRDDSGRVHDRRRLSRPRRIVLSQCQTRSTGQASYRVSGPIRSFLAGVVIATQGSSKLHYGGFPVAQNRCPAPRWTCAQPRAVVRINHRIGQTGVHRDFYSRPYSPSKTQH